MSETDVLILGGGLMGTASAFFLARQGVKVQLVETDFIGRQASGTNFGAARRQGRPLDQLPLSNRAREIWYDLPRLLGTDCEFVHQGHLRLALDDASADAMAHYHIQAMKMGLFMDLLEPDQVRRAFPFLGGNVRLASFSPLDGHANPRLTAPAFANAARCLGADIREHCPVSGLELDGRSFVARCGDGTCIRSDRVLVAMGAWSGKIAGSFGDDVPLTVKGPQLSVTEPLPYFLPFNVSTATCSPNEHVYFRQVTRGNIVMGGPFWGPACRRTMRAKVNPGILRVQWDEVAKLLPLIANAQIIRSWSGVEGYTPDGQPVMGESPNQKGLFYAYGFSGAGFQLGPAVGEVMAELIGRGASAISLEAYRPDRFRTGAVSLEAAPVAIGD